MSKHSTSFKLKIVRQFLDQGFGTRQLGIEHRLDHAMIRRWIASYQLHGVAGLEPKYSAYDAAFRLSVLHRKRLEDLSSNQVAAIFGIRNPSCINRWERQYHEGGMEALVPRPRGRPAMAKQQIPPLTNEPVPDSARSQEDLLRELEYLRAENAYLKKLDALIQSKKAAARKKRS